MVSVADAADVRPWATAAQQVAIDSLVRYGSIEAAAEALAIPAERLRSHLTEAQRRAARAGHSPAHDMTRTVPRGYHVKGVSTYYGKDGKPRGQWVKSRVDQQHRLELLLEAVQDATEPLAGAGGTSTPPGETDSDLLALYPIGDHHLGMYAWEPEAGQNWDLAKGESILARAVERLVGLAPHSSEAIVVSLGDFFHADDGSNRTPTQGNALDVDSRHAKVIGVGVRLYRYCVELALQKHDTVRVIIASGNHDPHASVVLSLTMDAYFRNDPRVIVETEPRPHHYHRFGANLLGFTHGHATKMQQCPGVMATDRAEDWGATRHRYWYTGHVHHDRQMRLQEYPGCIVESIRVLSPKDAWHSAEGYRSARDMKLDIFHRANGRVRRHIVGAHEVSP
jgi:hypothetical protein